MEPKDWIALAGIFATVSLSIVTLLINRRRERQQQERDDKLRIEQQKRDDELRRIQLDREDRLRTEQQDRETAEEWKRRTYSPHIEFEIRSNFYGPEEDWIIAEFLLMVHNKGLIQQKFKDIFLRVRGIESKKALGYWPGNEPRLEFPVKIVDNNSLLPKDYNYFFVEPGIEQVFTYITKIPAAVKYVLAHAEFEYDEFTPHTAEKVFAVRVGGYTVCTRTPHENRGWRGGSRRTSFGQSSTLLCLK